jgi:PAS domain S-box-containing protein
MRERAEELLGRLQKIAAKIPGVVYQYQQWQDGRTAFPYASPGIRDIYGVTPEQVAEDATPVLKALHPDDLARVAASIRDSMETLTTWHDTYRVVLPDGRTRWLEGESEPEAVPDGSVLWHGYIRDITRAREDAERQAAQLGELRRWQAVMLDREDRALPLKAEVNALLARLGEAPRYLVGLGGDALP